MDKLKEQLAPVLKYWFWISSAIVFLGSVGIWWMSSGTLIAEYDSASSKIEQDANSITTVSGKLSTHPNPKSHEEMQKLIKARTQEVLDAWTSVYERQKKIFVWPAELQEDFLSQFRDKTPIELKVQFPTDPEVESSLRKRYELYIGEVLPGLAEIAKTKWTAAFEKTGAGSTMEMNPYGGQGTDSSMMMPGATGILDDGPLVVWDSASQQRLLEDLFPWRGRLPTTLDVLYSQENLWILRQMMYIIRDVNGEAVQKFQAKIHQINGIQIGSKVKTTAGLLSKPASAAPNGMDGMMMSSDMSSDMSSSMMSGSDMGMTGMGEATPVDPGDNRYVDLAGKPLTASQLRGALSSKSPSDAFMAVAKRVPVMMSFKMDQRFIPELIAKCGSVPLMIEVRQVRILPKGTAGAANAMGGESGMSGTSSYGSTDQNYGGGMSTDTSGMSGMSGMGMTNNTPKDPLPLDLDVEIYGIIYIYNQPLEENLGIEKVTEEALAEAQAQVEGRSTDSPATAVAAAPTVTADTSATPPAAVNTVPPAAAGGQFAPAVDANPLQPGVAQPAPLQPGAVQPGAVQPGAVQPGAVQPGVAQPGVAQPGVAQPGVAQPGVAQPGVAQPGVGQPGQPGIPPAATVPAENGAAWLPRHSHLTQQLVA